MIPKLFLQTSRIVIRPYKLGDARELFHLVDRNRELLSDYFPMTVEMNRSVMSKRQYIIERNTERKNGKSLFAGIFLKEDSKLIGQICAKQLNWRVPKCELGYFIDRHHCGNGFASEALVAFSTFCFSELKMEKLSLRIEPSNKASTALATKCGFELIGISRNDFRGTNGRLMNCGIWERIRIKD